MDLPFTQEIHENYYIRVFSKDVETDELKWHYDLENRKVTILEGEDWEFQMDNELDRKSTRLNSSHVSESRMPSSA